ncbi:hypothetical protein BpHYR1_009799 [Brachionus plicatilis]|uniref:Uncharacterized protein n=1 Tax=Brachionus plicatilis TaxID=10195 RepID=A0A3M7PPI4_BRAPC|nr:hypothetical protein BpHYR1_009799 [Brachionus plicatilis]
MIGKLAFQKFYLFGKLSNQVYGNGYQCEKKKHFLITSRSFFGIYKKTLESAFSIDQNSTQTTTSIELRI